MSSLLPPLAVICYLTHTRVHQATRDWSSGIYSGGKIKTEFTQIVSKTVEIVVVETEVRVFVCSRVYGTDKRARVSLCSRVFASVFVTDEFLSG